MTIARTNSLLTGMAVSFDFPDDNSWACFADDDYSSEDDPINDCENAPITQRDMEINMDVEMPDYIDRVVNALTYDQTAEQIHAFLIGQGLSENDAYLTYKGAKLIFEDKDA